MSLCAVDMIGDVPESEEGDLPWQAAWDDVSDKELNPSGVKAARALEIEHVDAKKVWRKIPRVEATRQGCKVIGTRWVDIDKGDESKPDYRSRLVAQECNKGQEERLYTSTPPHRGIEVDIEPHSNRGSPSQETRREGDIDSRCLTRAL